MDYEIADMRYITLFLTLVFVFQASAEERKVTADSKLQVYLVVREVTILEKDAEEIGFDWLLPSKPAGKVPRRTFGDISGVFTNSQLQLMFRALKKQADAEIVTGPSLMVYPGQSGLLRVVSSRAVAVIPTLGADDFTIDLEIDLSQFKGRPLFRKPPTEVTIRDGQTAAINAGKRFGLHKTIFVTAQLCDSDGNPIGNRLKR